MATLADAVNLRKAAAYVLLDSAQDRVGIRKAYGYALLDSAQDRIGLSKAIGYALLDTDLTPWLYGSRREHVKGFVRPLIVGVARDL